MIVASLAHSTVRLLLLEDQSQLDERAAAVAMWSSTSPGLYQTHGMCTDPATVPYLLLSQLHHQLFAAVCYSTVCEQVEGSRPASPAAAGQAGDDGLSADELRASWGPVGMVGTMA